MKLIISFFVAQVLRQTFDVLFSKYLMGSMNGKTEMEILTGGKTLRERILKTNICLWNTLI